MRPLKLILVYFFLDDYSQPMIHLFPHSGDREVDLAMTEVFGGFSREFYKGRLVHSEFF
jgi:fructosamine-3-kinase